MKIGFITPNYPFEKRVAILPKQVSTCPNEIIIENGFGATMDIADQEYIDAGAKIMTRTEIFAQCNIIFSLKLIQPSDYDLLREGQIIVGWIHPTGSGKDFMEKQALPKKLVVIDLDNIYPSIYHDGQVYRIPFIQPNFIRKNSVIAGKAAVLHALINYGQLPTSETNVAVLSAGNVSQGAFEAISKFNANVRMFYRKTMHDFYDAIDQYDIIINGIEVDNPDLHIITKKQLHQVRKGCLIIDAAADAGNAIEGTHYATIGEPIYRLANAYVYCVNNAPSMLYRTASENISIAFADVFYNKEIQPFLDLIK